MGKSKLGKMMLLGAVVGGALSLFDRSTREVVKRRVETVTYYAKNPDILQENIEREVTKWTNVYNKFTREAEEIVEQVSQLKDLTPQVKSLVEETKEAFEETGDNERR